MDSPAHGAPFDLLLVAQAGRVGYEALLLVASLRHAAPAFGGRVVVAEPQPGPLWPNDPRIDGDLRAALAELGAEVRPLHSRTFGAAYPQGNKIEALRLLPRGRPFLFLDSDILMTGDPSAVPRDPARATASDRVRPTWPQPPPYGPGRGAIWQAVFDRAGVDIAPTLDPRHPPERAGRYLYCNAGWVAGPCGPSFGAAWEALAASLRDDPPDALAAQAMTPWLDQASLPPILARFGGGRADAPLDGTVLWHYRTLPLLFATAPDPVVDLLGEVARRNRVKRLLKRHAAFHRALYRGEGAAARALFDRDRLPRAEALIRNRLRRAGLWRR